MSVSIHSLRYFSFYLITLVLVSAAALGCRAAPPLPDPPETTAKNAPTSTTTTLTLWHSFTGEKRATLEAMARDFHKTYGNLTVNSVFVGNPDDLTKQVTAAIALGTPPDLVLTDRRRLAEFAAQGGLLTLDKFIADPQLGLSRDDQADFLRGTLAQGKYPTLRNRVYGFPFDLEAVVLFYNADLLRQAGYESAARSWTEFSEQARRVTKDGLFGWTMRADSDTFAAMLVSAGSALLTTAENRALFNERAGIASLSLVSELVKSDAAKLAMSDRAAQQEFASGHAAFYIGWMSDLPRLTAAQKAAQTNFQISVAPLPQRNPQEPYLLARGDVFGILKNPQQGGAQRARNAWFFVRWMTAPSQSARWVRTTDALPLRASALTFLAPELKTNARFRQVASAFGEVLPRFETLPARPHMEVVERMVQSVWLEMQQPKPQISATLDALAARVNQVLANNP